MHFIRRMFRVIQSRHYPEPNEFSLTSIPKAVYDLQKCTGMDRGYLGKRLGLTHTQMVNLESRGKPISRDLLTRLAKIAEEYNLAVLSEYFANQNLLFQNRERIKMRKETTGQ